MPFKRISIHTVNLEREKEVFRKRISNDECKKVFEFLKLLSVGEINKGKEIGTVRQSKYLDLLAIFISYFKKPIDSITKDDMRKFIESLTNDKIKKQNKEPYADATKQDIKLAVRAYLKWRIPKRYAELTDWIDTRLKKRTPDSLSEQEIEKLYNSCSSPAEKFLITVLFDSGARIEEFLNIRFEDIIPPTESFPYYKIDFKTEYSKTEGRTIGMYWKHSTQTIKDYLNECDKSDSKTQVYPKEYDAVRMFLTRLGKRILHKRLHPHLMRKSSATYYAPKMNRQQLCIRYGWKFSSDMPDMYIKRAGIEEDRVKDAVLNEDLTKIRKETEEIKTKFGLTKEQLEKMSSSQGIIAQKMNLLLKIFKNNPKAVDMIVKKDSGRLREVFS